MLKKKKNKMAIALICIFALTLSGTLALLSTTTNKAENTFNAIHNKVNVGIVEDKTYEELSDGSRSITLNNNQAVKSFSIKNIDRLNENLEDDPKGKEYYPTGKTLVRARIVPMLIYNQEGNTHDDNTVAGLDMSKLKMNVTQEQDSHWYANEQNGETYYYYSKAINKDETTKPLNITATYDGGIPAGTHLEIQVLTEGVNYNTSPGKDQEGKDQDGYSFAEQAWVINYANDGTIGTKVTVNNN